MTKCIIRRAKTVMYELVEDFLAGSKSYHNTLVDGLLNRKTLTTVAMGIYIGDNLHLTAWEPNIINKYYR